MRNKAVLLLLIIVSFFLQCTLMKGIAVGSVSPNLLVVLCVSIGLMCGRSSGFFYKIYYDDDIKVPILLTVVGDFAYNFFTFVFLFLLQGNTDFFFYLRRVIIPEIIYTLVLAALVYRIYYKVIRRFIRVKFKESDSLWLTK